MNRPVIFLGPTLPVKEAAAIFNAVYLPPAAQGDIVLAQQTYRPPFIALIDGYFECVPSVWHKEILYAMSEGIHVFGGSSMGALRAAELELFGMTGFGDVFESYKTGLIEDDDEVAVVHGPESIGYPLLAEAMVNIRKTFQDALDQEIITQHCHSLLISTAKNLHYKLRSYPNILQEARHSGLPEESERRMAAWLPRGRRDVKQEDARKLLHFLKDFAMSGFEPKITHYKFQHTTMWKNLLESLEGIDQKTEKAIA